MHDIKITSAEELCRALRRARRAGEQSQDDIAALLKVTRQTLSQWEAGNGSPGPEQVRTWIAAVNPDAATREAIGAWMTGAGQEVTR